MQLALLVLVLAASLAAFGGTYRWATGPLVLLAALTALPAPLATLRVSRTTWALDLAWLAAIAGVVLQLIPLPAAATTALSPASNQVRQALRLDAFAGAGVAPLTVDPAGTLHALGLAVFALLCFWSARRVFALGGVRRFSRALVALGSILVVAALAQRLLSPDRIYGYWVLQDPGARPFGPFVNRNHFAGWLVMACPVLTGYLVAHARVHLAEVRSWREGLSVLQNSGGARVAVGIVAMGVTLLLTLSRSGAAGLGAAAIAGWLISRGRLARSGRGLGALAAAGGLALLVALLLVDVDAWAARVASVFQARPVDRLVIWRETLPLVRDFWLTGVGAGGYGTAMLLYQHTLQVMPHLGGGFAHFNQAHSQYLQIVAEGGLLLGLPAAAGLVALVVLGRRRLMADRGEIFWIRAGAAAGLVGTAVQGIWETPLRMPADAALAAVLAALLLHQRVAPRGERSATGATSHDFEEQPGATALPSARATRRRRPLRD
ncbi:MAG: O-antigen ligase family protein [Vicinamibacterales bacterium]